MASARVNKVDQKRLSKPDERFKKQLPNKQNQEPRVCGSCGYREHEDKSKYPTRNRECNKCGKKGHLRKMCLSTKQHVKEVAINNDEDENKQDATEAEVETVDGETDTGL